MSESQSHPRGFHGDAAHDIVATCIERILEEGVGQLDALCARHPEHAAAIRNRVARLGNLGLLGASLENLRESAPERLGDFRLIDRLGHGGMGVVYRAEQTSLHREVALKLIRPEHLYFPGTRERFLREVQAVARLEHPGIVRVYTVGEESGIPFYAMEHIEGLTLDALLRELGGDRPDELTSADLDRLLRSR